MTLLAGLGCTPCVYAQARRADTLQAYEDGRLPEMFHLTRNPASLWQSPRPDYTGVSAGWQSTDDALRRPMTAAAGNKLGVAAAGYATVNGWTYQGGAQYSRQLDRNLAWSGVYDAYEGNPFLWTDSSRGNWERDHLQVSAIVNTPALGGGWHAGLQMGYHVGSGARKSDPKPFYRYRNIALAPGVSWQIRNTAIGAYGRVAFTGEDNEMGFYNSGAGNILLYRLRGYGTYTRAPFVSAERQRRGTAYEAGMHYSYQKGQFLTVLSIYGGINNETVYEGVVKRQAYGDYQAVNFGGAIAVHNKQKYASLSFDAVQGSGDDVEYNAQTAYANHYRVTGKAGYGKGGWQLELRPFLYDDEYGDVATATSFHVTSAGGAVELNRRWASGWQIKPSVGYRYVLQDSWQQGTNNIIIRELIYPDYQYFSASRMMAALTCGYALYAGRNVVHGITAQLGVEHAPSLTNKSISLQYSIVF